MADFSTTAGMIEHLREYIANGEVVPDTTIPTLEADQAENDAWMGKI
jgi:hypothetical protein